MVSLHTNAAITICEHCAAKVRVPVSSGGHPRCPRCHRDLPWLVDVGDADFETAVTKAALPCWWIAGRRGVGLCVVCSGGRAGCSLVGWSFKVSQRSTLMPRLEFHNGSQFAAFRRCFFFETGSCWPNALEHRTLRVSTSGCEGRFHAECEILHSAFIGVTKCPRTPQQKGATVDV